MHNIKYKDFFDDNFDLLNEKLSLYEVKVTPEIEQQIIDLYKNGKNSVEIGKEFQINHSTVSRVLRKHKIPRRSNSDAAILANTQRKKHNIPRRQNNNKVTSEMEQQIIDLYKSGKSANEIGKEFQITQTTVLSVLRKHNVSIRQYYNKVTPEMENQIIDLYKSGKSSIEIGKEFQISYSTVIRLLQKHNVSARQYNKLTPEIEQPIIDLYKSGKRCGEIAKEFQIEKTTVFRVLKKHNVSIRQLNKVTPEIEQQIIDLYKSGKSSGEIQKHLKIKSHTTVLNVLRKHKIPRRSNSDAAILANTQRKQDNLRKHHSTRDITGRGTSGTQYFDAGASDNVGSSRVIAKRLGGHSPTEE